MMSEAGNYSKAKQKQVDWVVGKPNHFVFKLIPVVYNTSMFWLGKPQTVARLPQNEFREVAYLRLWQ